MMLNNNAYQDSHLAYNKGYGMSIKNMISIKNIWNDIIIGLLIGLCVLFAGCSTGRYGYDRDFPDETTTDRGMRYLLGRSAPQSDEKAFYYFTQAANNDDPFAQNALAYLYATGKGTPQNHHKAFYYYQKAAQHDLASAQYSLGLMYWYGMGTEANPTVAKQWFQKSADHGFEPAMLALTKYTS